MKEFTVRIFDFNDCIYEFIVNAANMKMAEKKAKKFVKDSDIKVQHTIIFIR